MNKTVDVTATVSISQLYSFYDNALKRLQTEQTTAFKYADGPEDRTRIKTLVDQKRKILQDNIHEIEETVYGDKVTMFMESGVRYRGVKG